MRTKKAQAEAKAGTGRALSAVIGTVLLAATLYAVLAAPGFMSDRNSTVPARAREARR